MIKLRGAVCCSLVVQFLTVMSVWGATGYTNGLVLHYTFESHDGATVADISGNGNNGAVHGPILDVNGAQGACYRFDGINDYISLPPDAKQTGPCSISAWFTIEDDSERKSLYGGGGLDTSVDRNGLAISHDPKWTDNRLYFDVYFTGQRNLIYVERSHRDYADGNWHHVVGVYDGDTMAIYVDGELGPMGYKTIGSATIDWSHVGHLLGRRAEGDGLNWYWNGRIDDFRIYDHPLASNVVAELYDEVVNPPPDLTDGLVAYYPFNGNANDESGNGRHGTVNGAALTTDRNGVSGSAYHFTDGVDRIEVSSIPTLQTFTMSAWFRATETTAPGSIIGFDGQYVLILSAVDRLRGDTKAGSSPGGGWTGGVGASGEMTDGTWRHVVWSRSATGHQEFYVDGVLVDAADCNSGTIPTSLYGGYIGLYRRADGVYSSMFQGDIDDVRFYNRVLSSNEVEVLHGLEAPSIDLTVGLIAYYPFNGNANDESGNGHDATVYGATVTNAGCTGGGYYFDGNGDYIDLGGATKQTGPFTVSIWFTYESAGGYATLYGGGGLDTGVDRNGIALTHNAESDQLVLDAYAPPTRHATRIPNSAAGYMDGRWHHVVGTYDGTNMAIFIDGILGAEGWKPIGSVTIDWSWVNHYLGRRAEGSSPTWYWTGKMDEVRIYNRGMSSNEINALYDLNVPESAPDLTDDLVLHYTFDGDSGTTIWDSSGNAHHGTTVGGMSHAAGVQGLCGRFDGVDDYVAIATDVITSATYTVTAWIRMNTVPAGSVAYEVLGAASTQSPGYFSTDIQNGGRVTHFLASGDAGQPQINRWKYWSDERIGAARWYHVVFRHDGVAPTMFVDGVPIAQALVDGSATDNAWSLDDLASGTLFTVGARVHTTGRNFFDGLIDELRVYERALSDDDILRLYAEDVPVDLTDGLIAYYPFNGNANDESGNGHDATVYGATVTNAGCTGGGYYFDGSGDYMDLGSATKQTGPFTVSIWFTYDLLENRRVSLYGGGGLDTNVDRNGIAISRFTDDRLFLDVYTTGHRYAVWLERSENDYMDGRWHHVVGTYDGDRMGMFVDGKLTAYGWRQIGDIDIDWSWVNHYLGRRAEGGGLDWYWQGAMDEVRIYNRGLSSNEVTHLYALDAPPSPPVPDLTSDLVLHYTFDDYDGSHVADHSHNGNDGSVFGATQVLGTVSQGWYAFDGQNDYVRHAAGRGVLSGTGVFTLSAWVKTSSSAGQIVMQQRDRSGIDGEFWYGLSYGRMAYFEYNRGEGLHFWSDPVLADGQWHHMALVRTETNGCMYIDGVPNSYDTGPTLSMSPSLTFAVGCDYRDSGAYFDGSMDDVRVYARALTPVDVAGLAAATRPVDLNSDLILHYTFDDYNGTNLIDFSPMGNDGTVNGPVPAPDMTSGPIGAYAFDGVDDYVSCLSPRGLDSSTFTLSFWLLSDDAEAGLRHRIFYYSDPGTDYFGFRVDDYESTESDWPDKLVFRLTDPNGAARGAMTVPKPVAGWHQFTWVVAPAGMAVYQDGLMVTNRPYVSPLFTADMGVIIGRMWRPTDAPFSGRVDDLRIYSRGLTPGEVSSLHRLPQERALLWVAGNPYTWGTPRPDAYGANYYPVGDVVTNGVDSPVSAGTGSQYVCTGWTGGGGVPVSGASNSLSFTVSQTSLLVWQWQTQHRLDCGGVHGKVAGGPSGFYDEGFFVDLYPEADFGYVFDHWLVNGSAAGRDTPLNLAMSMPLSVEPVFAPAFVDVSLHVDVQTAWAFNWQTGTFFASVTVSNRADSLKGLIEPFWYVAATSAMTRLRFPDGVETNSGYPYVDITAAVVDALPAVGNGDTVMDPGESVTVTGIEFISRDRHIPEGFVVAVWADPPSVPPAGDAAVRDTDHDGMPNAWEDQFAALNRGDARDAERDADGDGMANAGEWVAGTNPEDARSVLALTGVAAGRGCRLKWLSTSNRLYSVYRSTDLANGFELLATNLMASPPVNVFTDPAPPLRGPVYYRVTVRVAGGADGE